MKCKKCGEILNETSKFCPNCGKKITALENKVNNNVDNVKSKNDNNKPNAQIKNLFNKFKLEPLPVKFAIVLIVICCILAMTALLKGSVAAVIVAVVSLMISVFSVLVEKEIIKVQIKRINLVALLLAIILLLPYGNLLNSDSERGNNTKEQFEWEHIILNNIIPEPTSFYGSVYSNSDEYLSLTIYDNGEEDYRNYVEKCIEMGFDIEIEQQALSFIAYNKDGYKITIEFEYSEDISIELEAPDEYNKISWPKKGMAQILPTPESSMGRIDTNDSEKFKAYVSEMSKALFNEYVNECVENGFDVDEINRDKSFSAKNSDGYKLEIEYIGNSVICIVLEEPEYEIEFEVKCTENVMFSTYDVDVYLDDDYLGELEHGQTDYYNEVLKKGVYTLKFVNAEDSSVYGSVKLKIDGTEMSFNYRIHCFSDSISVYDNEQKEVTENETTSKEAVTEKLTESEITSEVVETTLATDEVRMDKSAYDYGYENYMEVEKELKDKGFTNIKINTSYELNTGWLDSAGINDVKEISIGGNSEFKSGDVFKKNAKVIIVYKDFKINDPAIKYNKYTVSKLMSDLENNAYKAEEKHNQEYVEISGRVDVINSNGKSFTLYPSDNKYAWQGVQCSILIDAQKEKILDFNKGDMVTVKGKITLVDEYWGYSMDVYQIV